MHILTIIAIALPALYCVLYFYSFYVLAYYITLLCIFTHVYLSTYALRVRNGKIVKYMKVCT